MEELKLVNVSGIVKWLMRESTKAFRIDVGTVCFEEANNHKNNNLRENFISMLQTQKLNGQLHLKVLKRSLNVLQKYH